jgi:hypothetical protein
VPPVPRLHLPPEVETALDRVVREPLTDVAKHAGTEAMSVCVEHARDVGAAGGDGEAEREDRSAGRQITSSAQPLYKWRRALAVGQSVFKDTCEFAPTAGISMPDESHQTGSGGKTALRCSACGRTQACSAADRLRFTRQGWPRCCGEVMDYFAHSTPLGGEGGGKAPGSSGESA